MKYHLTTIRKATIKRNPENNRCWWDVEKLEPLCAVGRNVKWYSCCGNSSSNVKLPCDPEIPLLRAYLKELKARTWADICTPTFLAAFFTIATRWKQPKSVWADGWISRMWPICLCALKTWDSCSGCHVLDPEDFMLKETSQTQRDSVCVIPLVWGARGSQTHRHRSRMVVARAWGQKEWGVSV